MEIGEKKNSMNNIELLLSTYNAGKIEYNKIIKSLHGKSVSSNQFTENIWYNGDNLDLMKLLLTGDDNFPNLRGKINLIYIDPPYNTNNNFYGKDDGEKVLAYTDKYGGIEGYLKMIIPRLCLMRDLLAEDGSIYVHCDWRVNSYLRLIMDEIFGKDFFKNEIIWKRKTSSSGKTRISNSHDTILYYTKSENIIFNTVYKEYDKEYIKKQFKKDGNGKLYRRHDVVANPALGGNSPKYKYKGYIPETRWLMTKDKLMKLDEEGKLEWSSSGRPYRKQYLDESEGQMVNDVWEDISIVSGNEKVGYPTQKPEELIERIIKLSSNYGDIIADFFCGSGTTLAVAEKLGRKWIGSDSSELSNKIVNKRMKKVQKEQK